MTVLYGHLQDVMGTPFDQAGTAVTISATQARPAMNSDALVLVELARIEMEDSGGHFETEELDPGPVIVRLDGGVSHGQQWEIGIPDDGERRNLADLVGEQVEWEPIVVSRAEAAARESRQYAEAQRALYEDLDAIKTARDESASSSRAADKSQKAAAESEKNASTSEDRAKSEADRSAGQARDSANSATTADGHRKAAADSETNAKTSETNAGKHEDNARDYSTTAEEHRDTADAHRKAAATSENNAKTSETNADGYATDAQQSAEVADRTVRNAVAEVTKVTEGHKNDAENAAGNAASSAAEGRGYRDKAREYMDQAERISTGDLPNATDETRGLIILTGDLSGTGDNPTVPALYLAAPGASVCVTPPSEGWANATAPAASTPTGWGFDGEWLSPPRWLSSVHVTLDWCGGSAAVLRGRRPDGTASTLATVPEGTPETHRSVTVLVDLDAAPTLAVGGQWTPEDIEAGCTASLIVRPLPEHQHSIDDVHDLREELRQKVDETDRRLDDPRKPLAHKHPTTDIVDQDTKVDLDTMLDRLMLLATRGGVWFSGDGPPPDDLPGSRVGDYWYDETDNEFYEITEVIDDDDSD